MQGREGSILKKKKVGNYIYNPSDRLGEGQYGKVYRAVHKDKALKLPDAAIKVIEKNQILDDEYTKNAIVREIQIMKNLHSPNIIQLLEVHETVNNIYLIQELAEEGTLKDLMSEYPNGFTEQAALPLILQLINGFAELSKNGIIHRDIKPTNILVKSNTIKLADFGLSRYSDKMSFMNSVVGTPAYMAPQVLNRQVFEKYSYKCDIWSFGVVCYELLVGTLPWPLKGNNLNDLYHAIKDICTKGISFPSLCQASQNMKDLIRGCLQFQQKQRLDWTHIFRHPVFQGKFAVHSDIEREQYIQEAFTLTRLRMSVHSQNLNLHKMLKKMPDSLTYEDFAVIIRVMDSEINPKQIQCIFRVASNKEDTITRTELLKYLQKHNIFISGLKLPKLGQSIELTNIGKIIQDLAAKVQEKQIDLQELYSKFDRSNNNALNVDDFSSMLRHIEKGISQEDLPKIFKEFDSNGDGRLSYSECREKLCKISQVAFVQDTNLQQSIRKIQAKKSDLSQ